MKTLHSKFLRTFACAALATCGFFASAAEAEESQFTLMPYLWNAGFEGTLGAPNAGGGRIDVTFDQLLENLEVGGLMLYADWRKGPWSVFGDASHVKVTSSAAGPLAGFVGADAEIRGNIFQAAVGYSLYRQNDTYLDAYLGLRYYDIDISLDLSAGALGTFSTRGEGTWTDGIIGLRWRTRLGEHWDVGLSADIGAGGSDISWQGVATIGYAFSWGSIVGGWRHLSADRDTSSFKLDATLSGPFLGAAFRF